MQPCVRQYEALLKELIDARLDVYKKLYLKDRMIENIIVVDDYLSPLLQKTDKEYPDKGYGDKKRIDAYLAAFRNKSISDLSGQWDMPEENMLLTYISLIMTGRIMETTGAGAIWAPGVTLSDGIAYEYAEKNKLIAATHDFEKDIIACAYNISKRYRGSRKRSETLEQIALTIFDSMKKIHGLGKRERMLLSLCADTFLKVSIFCI